VRALAAGAQPVMVALTGWGREDDLRRTRDAGFDFHLVKPVGPDELLEVLNSARR
jgi:CheY-like chemotaxis protein